MRKAYLQIQIRPEDRDALRFLWLTELPSATSFHPECQEWRMTRVPFGASSSPFLGLSAQDLIDNNAWWKGPPWLSNRIDHSASPEADLDSSLESELVCSPVATGGQDALIRLEDYSSLRRLLRITAYVLGYVANLRRPDAKRTGPLSAQELLSAERLWVERTQGETFATEIADLKNSRPLPRSSSILTLNPYLDSSSPLRVGGRLQQMEDTERVRHPILLPSKHRLTELLIMDVHMRLHHAGIQDTLCELRQSYWVTKGRQAVRRTLHTCLQCRRRRLSPETAPVAPLPRERLTPSLPFDTVGVDFAGPLYVSREDGTEHKAYITLFTCGVTRPSSPPFVASSPDGGFHP
ncbi:uncharacterized protein LOC135381655 [Ornithodoros turicata]|uniref:uncharacterized protein LOC135381655 n=1 Tax=Ornithodoros turicata TaxID=34597 RepID=UPI0031396BA2